MKNSKAFATTAIIFSIFSLLMFLIASTSTYVIKIKHNKIELLNKTNDKLDDKEEIKKIIYYTKN